MATKVTTPANQRTLLLQQPASTEEGNIGNPGLIFTLLLEYGPRRQIVLAVARQPRVRRHSVSTCVDNDNGGRTT